MEPVQTWYKAITSGRAHERRSPAGRSLGVSRIRRRIGSSLISLGRLIAAEKTRPAALSRGR